MRFIGNILKSGGREGDPLEPDPSPGGPVSHNEDSSTKTPDRRRIRAIGGIGTGFRVLVAFRETLVEEPRIGVPPPPETKDSGEAPKPA